MSILPILLPLLLSADGHDSKPEREVLSVLLVDGQNNHAWPRTSPVLRAILEETGRFTVDVATSPPNGADLSGFQPDFAAYDVVVSNYNGATWPEETRDAFEAYVSGGGGFVCVHAADNAFPEWRAYNEMIAVGGWGRRTEASGPYLRLRDGAWTQDTTAGRGGSHGRQHEFLLEARAEHPILEGLPERWLHTQDELYDRLRGPALNVTVLASAYSRKETGGSGEHEPILMTIDYGEGRVFHTTMGHDVPALRCVGFQATLARGAEWVATGGVTLPVPEGFPTAEASSARDPQGFTPLFDGKTLEGWVQKNGSATYRVEDGAIVGKTDDGSPNSFLCTTRDYGDFELLFEVKVDSKLNSGVQLRSRSLADYRNGRVHGPQVEIEASPGEAGHFFSEGTKRGWLSPADHREDPQLRGAFRNDEWNRYRVRAEGARLRSWINGKPVGDVTDEQSSRSGFIGLQVHSIGVGSGPFEVRWRNIRVREL